MRSRTIVLLVLALAVTTAASAQPVHRCVNADGHRVFSDRSCHFLGLAPQPPSAAEAAAAAQSAPTPSLEVDERSRPSAADGCPGQTPADLRDAVAAALAASDINGLAGMYHWAGAGKATASSVIGHFQALIASRAGVVELRRPADADAWLWAGLPPPEVAPVPELHILRQAFDEHALARFRLRPQAGCYWLAD